MTQGIGYPSGAVVRVFHYKTPDCDLKSDLYP